MERVTAEELVRDYVELRNALEVSNVARHQRSILNPCRSRNQQIHCRNGLTAAAHLAEQATIFQLEPLIGWYDPESRAERGDASVLDGRCAGKLRAGVQLACYMYRDRQLFIDERVE